MQREKNRNFYTYIAFYCRLRNACFCKTFNSVDIKGSWMSVISRNRWNFTRHAVSCYISANGVFEVSNHVRMGMFVGWLLNWQFRLSFKQCSRAQITMKFRGQCFVVKKNERIRRDMRIRFSSLKNFRLRNKGNILQKIL